MVIAYKNLTKEQYLLKFLEIIDCMQSDKSKCTTDSEKDVLVKFLLLPEEYKYYRFSRKGKKAVTAMYEKEEVKMSHQNLNNKIYSLIEKGLLWRDDDTIIYFKKFVIQAVSKFSESLEKGESYDFKFRFINEA